LIYTLTAFATVQIGIWRMINTAREACSDAEQRRRLQFLRNVTPHVWNTFWVMWFCQYFGILTVFQAELGNMIGNFVAKVKPNSCWPDHLLCLLSAMAVSVLAAAMTARVLAVSNDRHCPCCSNDSVCFLSAMTVSVLAVSSDCPCARCLQACVTRLMVQVQASPSKICCQHWVRLQAHGLCDHAGTAVLFNHVQQFHVHLPASHKKPENDNLLQALLSSSIMFSNFMSIYQRRAESKEKAEQSNR